MVGWSRRSRGGRKAVASAGAVVTALFLGWATLARAQELEPRAYSPSPVGTNFFAVSFGALKGDVLFDPALPVTDVHASIDIATLGYGRVFGLAGRQCGVLHVFRPDAHDHIFADPTTQGPLP